MPGRRVLASAYRPIYQQATVQEDHQGLWGEGPRSGNGCETCPGTGKVAGDSKAEEMNDGWDQPTFQVCLPTAEMSTDRLTNSLPRQKLEHFQRMLSLVNIQDRLDGSLEDSNIWEWH